MGLALRSTVLVAVLGVAAACEKMDGNGNGNPDAGGNNGTCTSSELPQAAVTCTRPACNVTTGTKTYGVAELASPAGTSWTVVSWAVSEVTENANLDVDYRKVVKNALSPDERRRGRPPRDLDPFVESIVHAPDRLDRVRAEAALRAGWDRAPLPEGPLAGTAIQGRTGELLPPGVVRQNAMCDATAPASCGATALCVIPEGMTAGRCETALRIKFKGTSAQPAMVNASVKKVGRTVAVAVDDQDAASVSAADVDALVMRFDDHIAPRDHAFFGEPKVDGKDRDQNGVVLVLLTKRVGAISGSLVGFFFADDLKPTQTVAHSNAADILYVQPPGGAITLDAISGTLAHEYQHLINYTSKVLKGRSDPETVWLDEGISTFAEDVAGYGRDAFTDDLAYLQAASDTSLTGFGLLNTNEDMADSVERRGFAHLLVRYVFEQKGGATFGAKGAEGLMDKGGVAAVKAMVQSADTGFDAVTAGGSGRSFKVWFTDLLTTIAVDGTSVCAPKYNLVAPEMDAFTGFQRGVDLRTTVNVPGGTSLPLKGPKTETFETMTGVPLPVNGGEFRTLSLPSGSVEISIGGPVDEDIGFRPIPVAK